MSTKKQWQLSMTITAGTKREALWLQREIVTAIDKTGAKPRVSSVLFGLRKYRKREPK